MNDPTGDAALDAVRDAALLRIGAALGLEVTVRRALRSVSNSAWLIDMDGALGVLRLHTLGFGAPVTDHAREIEIHRLAANAGLAPRIVFSDIAHNILVTDYVEAGTFGERAATYHASLAAIGECLAQLHALTIPASLPEYSLASAADSYVARAGVDDDDDMRGLAARVHANEALADPTDRALCHRDLLYSNILDCRPVQLIDWEFASPGERWFDLAAMIAWHKLSERKQLRLLDAYLGRKPSAHERDAVVRNIASFDALCTLWSLPAKAP